MNARQTGAAAGITGPLVFAAISLSGGWIQPGYSVFSDYVSALSLGGRGWVQIVSFVIVGVCLLLFARAVAREFAESAIPSSGPVVLAVIGLGHLLSGPFAMDPQGTPVGVFSAHGLIHSLLGAMVFVLMPVVCFIFLRQFGRHAALRSLWWPTLVLGCAVAVADIAFAVIAKGSVVTRNPRLVAIMAADAGLLQRLVIIPFMSWVALFAAKLLSRSGAYLQ
ncbi:DUF998 domain-containing protein [Bradyrhizobium liaoningense]|uniref:DUF998 domain-containing protein n=1 Tax=Bradyrhizobium liaoningense TaxID=43992 RepID=UPI001BA6009F|nr:DUF998 domain-containing protein [Bradyrhizobium liaoningense]MBR0859157.1 DUF998 domain-containing protein [Bradyrhizobium liaoningense]